MIPINKFCILTLWILSLRGVITEKSNLEKIKIKIKGKSAIFDSKYFTSPHTLDAQDGGGRLEYAEKLVGRGGAEAPGGYAPGGAEAPGGYAEGLQPTGGYGGGALMS